MVSYHTKWRAERKLRAESLGIDIENLLDERFTITNKSNYFSDKHRRYLYKAAYEIARKFGAKVDVDELVDVGWYKVARYKKDITGEYGRIRDQMYNFTMSRYRRVNSKAKNIPIFVCKTDKGDDVIDLLPFRDDKLLSVNDSSPEQVKEIFELCSPDERELLHMRFHCNMTYGEIGKIFGKKQSNITIKYQRLFERIRKRLRGEETRGLRVAI